MKTPPTTSTGPVAPGAPGSLSPEELEKKKIAEAKEAIKRLEERQQRLLDFQTKLTEQKKKSDLAQKNVIEARIALEEAIKEGKIKGVRPDTKLGAAEVFLLGSKIRMTTGSGRKATVEPDEPEVARLKAAHSDFESKKPAMEAEEKVLQQELASLGVLISAKNFSIDAAEKRINTEFKNLEVAVEQEEIKTPDGKKKVTEKIAREIESGLPEAILSEAKSGDAFQSTIEFEGAGQISVTHAFTGAEKDLSHFASSKIVPANLRDIETAYGKDIAYTALEGAYAAKIASLVEKAAAEMKGGTEAEKKESEKKQKKAEKAMKEVEQLIADIQNQLKQKMGSEKARDNFLKDPSRAEIAQVLSRVIKEVDVANFKDAAIPHDAGSIVSDAVEKRLRAKISVLTELGEALSKVHKIGVEGALRSAYDEDVKSGFADTLDAYLPASVSITREQQAALDRYEELKQIVPGAMVGRIAEEEEARKAEEARKKTVAGKAEQKLLERIGQLEQNRNDLVALAATLEAEKEAAQTFEDTLAAAKGKLEEVFNENSAILAAQIPPITTLDQMIASKDFKDDPAMIEYKAAKRTLLDRSAPTGPEEALRKRLLALGVRVSRGSLDYEALKIAIAERLPKLEDEIIDAKLAHPVAQKEASVTAREEAREQARKNLEEEERKKIELEEQERNREELRLQNELALQEQEKIRERNEKIDAIVLDWETNGAIPDAQYTEMPSGDHTISRIELGGLAVVIIDGAPKTMRVENIDSQMLAPANMRALEATIDPPELVKEALARAYQNKFIAALRSFAEAKYGDPSVLVPMEEVDATMAAIDGWESDWKSALFESVQKIIETQEMGEKVKTDFVNEVGREIHEDAETLVFTKIKILSEYKQAVATATDELEIRAAFKAARSKLEVAFASLRRTSPDVAQAEVNELRDFNIAYYPRESVTDLIKLRMDNSERYLDPATKAKSLKLMREQILGALDATVPPVDQSSSLAKETEAVGSEAVLTRIDTEMATVAEFESLVDTLDQDESHKDLENKLKQEIGVEEKRKRVFIDMKKAGPGVALDRMTKKVALSEELKQTLSHVRTEMQAQELLADPRFRGVFLKEESDALRKAKRNDEVEKRVRIIMSALGTRLAEEQKEKEFMEVLEQETLQKGEPQMRALFQARIDTLTAFKEKIGSVKAGLDFKSDLKILAEEQRDLISTERDTFTTIQNEIETRASRIDAEDFLGTIDSIESDKAQLLEAQREARAMLVELKRLEVVLPNDQQLQFNGREIRLPGIPLKRAELQASITEKQAEITRLNAKSPAAYSNAITEALDLNDKERVDTFLDGKIRPLQKEIRQLEASVAALNGRDVVNVPQPRSALLRAIFAKQNTERVIVKIPKNKTDEEDDGRSRKKERAEMVIKGSAGEIFTPITEQLEQLLARTFPEQMDSVAELDNRYRENRNYLSAYMPGQQVSISRGGVVEQDWFVGGEDFRIYKGKKVYRIYKGQYPPIASTTTREISENDLDELNR